MPLHLSWDSPLLCYLHNILFCLQFYFSFLWLRAHRQITLHFNPIYSLVVYILGWPYKIRYDQGDNVSVALAFSVRGTFEKLTTFNTNITVSTNPYKPEWYIGTPSLISFTYNVKGEEFLIGYYNPTTETQRLKISVYLTD